MRIIAFALLYSSLNYCSAQVAENIKSKTSEELQKPIGQTNFIQMDADLFLKQTISEIDFIKLVELNDLKGKAIQLNADSLFRVNVSPSYKK